MEFKDKNILIIGGNSDIGKALARDLAAAGSRLWITSRKYTQLNTFCSDLTIRHGVSCQVRLLDILDFESHRDFYQSLETKPDIVITTVGYLDEQDVSEENFNEAQKSIFTNYVGLVSLLNIVANDFEARGTGAIVGVSSVAGDRGRGSNYIYGSAKAAYTAYLSGLRNRLSPTGVHVMTVKPGFINTKMTAGLDLPKPVTAKPEKVSTDILKGLRKKKNTVYTLWMWRWIMCIIRAIPESIFKKLKL